MHAFWEGSYSIVTILLNIPFYSVQNWFYSIGAYDLGAMTPLALRSSHNGVVHEPIYLRIKFWLFWQKQGNVLKQVHLRTLGDNIVPLSYVCLIGNLTIDFSYKQTEYLCAWTLYCDIPILKDKFWEISNIWTPTTFKKWYWTLASSLPFIYWTIWVVIHFRNCLFRFIHSPSIPTKAFPTPASSLPLFIELFEWLFTLGIVRFIRSPSIPTKAFPPSCWNPFFISLFLTGMTYVAVMGYDHSPVGWPLCCINSLSKEWTSYPKQRAFVWRTCKAWSLACFHPCI